MPQSRCPSDTVLSAYAVGSLGDDAWDETANHLRNCVDCVTRLDKLTPRDPLLDALRGYSDATPLDPQYARVAVGLLGEPATGRLRPGTMVREYRILELLGEGGMGAVYKACHERLDKLVAVKVLNRGGGPETLARFAREMKAAGRLRHPHVVAATDAGEADGVPYLVMEYVEGCDLAKLVRQRGRLRLPDACEAVRQAALGLAHAHAAGLVHRDVKPSNLILAADGTVKVLDLGLAVWSDRHAQGVATGPSEAATSLTDDDLTGSSRTVGTHGYMAPEQVADAHAVDARADVFGLGRTLIYLASGRSPDANVEIPGVSASLLNQLTAENPRDRLPDAAAVARAMRQPARAADLVALAAGRPPACRRSWPPYAVAAVVLIAGAIAWACRSGDESPSISATAGPSLAVPPAPIPVPEPGVMPMSPTKAADFQASWAAHLRRTTIVDGADALRFALVPPGTLLVSPKFSAVLSKSYEMSVCEITVGQYRAFVAASGHQTEGVANGLGSLIVRFEGRQKRGVRAPQYRWDEPGFADSSDDMPVVHVSWHDATAYCEWLSKLEGRTCRLPTLAEWRWALQAGAVWPLENAVVSEIMVAAFDQTNLPSQPKPVGGRKANAWGLYDMFGNVGEWTSELYNPIAPSEAGSVTDPKGPSTGMAAWTAGGSYLTWPIEQSTRTHFSLRYSSSAVGFRVLREIAAPETR